MSATPSRESSIQLISDLEPKAFRGLMGFVDVIYGAVLGFGVIEMAEALKFLERNSKGNATPLVLLTATSLFLIFDYAQARMCIELYPYRGLARFTLDICIPIAFVFAFAAAFQARPIYLISITVILLLGASWLWACKLEYPALFQHFKALILAHVVPAGVLFVAWLAQFIFKSWADWINWIIGGLYFLYCVVASALTGGESLMPLERRLLPIIPLHAPIRRFNRLVVSSIRGFKRRVGLGVAEDGDSTPPSAKE